MSALTGWRWPQLEVHEGEAIALWNAMVWIISMGLHNVQFETDSKTLVDAIKARSAGVSEFGIIYAELASEVSHGRGKVPVADYKVANYIDKGDFNEPSDSMVENRSCYSFCMCPGGQVVLTSTSPSEICINGMSFSRRASRWANAALVVSVTKNDFEALNYYGPLAGVEFQ
ncbi:hypothetical protein L195_g034474, partial [Trifolium pratense]